MALDQRRVRDAEAQDEPARVHRLDRAGGRPRRRGVAAVDVGDAGADRHPARGAQVQLRGGEGLPADGLAEPQRAPALVVEFTEHVGDPGGREALERAGPQADPAQLLAARPVPVVSVRRTVLEGTHVPECARPRRRRAGHSPQTAAPVDPVATH